MAQRHDQSDPPNIDLEDPLGIAHEPIARTPEDHVPADPGDPNVRRRRARAGLDGHDDRPLPGMGDINVDPDGAAGIDMGYGGEGTDVKPGS